MGFMWGFRGFGVAAVVALAGGAAAFCHGWCAAGSSANCGTDWRTAPEGCEPQNYFSKGRLADELDVKQPDQLVPRTATMKILVISTS